MKAVYASEMYVSYCEAALWHIPKECIFANWWFDATYHWYENLSKNMYVTLSWLEGLAFIMPVSMNANNRSIKVLILPKADDVTKTASGCAMNRCINVRKLLD